MPVARQQSSWVVTCAAAIAIASVVIVIRRQPMALVAPPDSPGLSEWIAIAIARTAHAAPIAAWMTRANDAIIGVAIALFIALARRCGAGWIAAIPAALAFGLSASFDPVLAPFQCASMAIAAATCLALAGLGQGRRISVAACAGLASTAMVEPRLTVAAGVLAGWVVASSGEAPGTARRLTSAAVAGAMVLLVAGLEAAIPSLPPGLTGATSTRLSYAVSQIAAHSWRDAWAAAWHLFTMAGPLAAALAVSGAFMRRRSIRDRAAAAVLMYALFSVVAAGTLGSNDARWLAPGLVGFWLLVVLGLHEITRGARQGARGLVVAGLLVVLLPLLKIARPPAPPSPEFVPRGHDRISLDAFKRLAASLPDGAVVVHADAIGDLLLRALDGTWQRMGKSLRAEAAESPALGAAVGDERTPLFALPAAQAQLPNFGFRLEDADLNGVTGLARVRPGGACTTIDAAWHDVPTLTLTPAFSLVSEQSRWEGPLVLYAESGHRLDAAPIDWPGTTSRGFGGRTYARGTPGDVTLLEQTMAADGFPASGLRPSATDVVRLELWHPPEAPRILAVALSDRPARLLARIGSASTPQSVTMCPVFAYRPRGF